MLIRPARGSYCQRAEIVTLELKRRLYAMLLDIPESQLHPRRRHFLYLCLLALAIGAILAAYLLIRLPL